MAEKRSETSVNLVIVNYSARKSVLYSEYFDTNEPDV